MQMRNHHIKYAVTIEEMSFRKLVSLPNSIKQEELPTACFGRHASYKHLCRKHYTSNARNRGSCFIMALKTDVPLPR